MKQISVNLISDQTLPNLLLIKELRPMDMYVLITTSEMEQKHKSDHLILASGIESSSFKKVVVQEDSITDIQEKLKQALPIEDSTRYIINLTGGTKMMAIGVQQFFHNRKCEMFYIPIGKNIYRQIFPEVQHCDTPIQYRATIDEYLKSYGIDIQSKMETLVKEESYTLQFFKTYSHFHQNDFEMLGQLREFRERKRIALDVIEGLEGWLNHLRFPLQQSDSLTKHEIKYLTGEWLEEYVFQLLKHHLHVDESKIVCGISISRGSNVHNEFDVMLTYDNKLYVIECKTSIYSDKDQKNILDESLYKLSSLKTGFGLRIPCFLTTLSHRGEKKNQIKQRHIDRSKLMDIDVIDGNQLKDPKTFLSLLTS